MHSSGVVIVMAYGNDRSSGARSDFDWSRNLSSVSGNYYKYVHFTNRNVVVNAGLPLEAARRLHNTFHFLYPCYLLPEVCNDNFRFLANRVGPYILPSHQIWSYYLESGLKRAFKSTFRLTATYVTYASYSVPDLRSWGL